MNTHTNVGQTREETQKLLEEHNSFKEKAKETREKVKLLLQLADTLMEKGMFVFSPPIIGIRGLYLLTDLGLLFWRQNLFFKSTNIFNFNSFKEKAKETMEKESNLLIFWWEMICCLLKKNDNFFSP